MYRSVLYIIIFLAVSSLYCQVNERVLLKGKLSSDGYDVSGIYIVNLNTETSTQSQNGGYFQISTKPGDSLMFSAIKFRGKRVKLYSADFEKDLFHVYIHALPNQLDEVIVSKYQNINAVSLGILPKAAKTYTQAERKLYVASGTPMSLDPLLNMLTGKTAMLRKTVEVERKEMLMQAIVEMFEEDYFLNQLKIPRENYKGFLFVIVEDAALARAVKAKNKELSSLIMAGLATTFKAGLTGKL